MAASRSRLAERPTAYVRATASAPPTNAATGSARWPRSESGRYAIAIVAPRPAPAATPSRYGSASGFRNTPWYVAPATASIAPTRAASTTRGTRISQSTASSVGESRSHAGHVQPRSGGLGDRTWRQIDRPGEHAHGQREEQERDRREGPHGREPAWADLHPPLGGDAHCLGEPRQRRRHRPVEVDEPRAPTRRDRVVDPDDRAGPDGADAIPAGAAGDGGRPSGRSRPCPRARSRPGWPRRRTPRTAADNRCRRCPPRPRCSAGRGPRTPCRRTSSRSPSTGRA